MAPTPAKIKPLVTINKLFGLFGSPPVKGTAAGVSIGVSGLGGSIHEEAVRVDNGSEFKKHFIKACQELGIQIIRNPVRHPTSNGKVERMHRTIEEECFWRVHAKPNDLDYARYWLSRYLAWYNTKRRHGGYGMAGRTPQQRIEDWIINTPSYLEGSDVNETLILYIT